MVNCNKKMFCTLSEPCRCRVLFLFLLHFVFIYIFTIYVVVEVELFLRYTYLRFFAVKNVFIPSVFLFLKCEKFFFFTTTVEMNVALMQR